MVEGEGPTPESCTPTPIINGIERFLFLKCPLHYLPAVFVYLRHGFSDPRLALNCSSQDLWLPGAGMSGTYHHIPRQGLLESLGLHLPPGTFSPLWLLELTLPVLPVTAEDSPSFP